MAREIPEWAQIGAEVVHIRSSLGGRVSYGETATITNRMGNGNIKVSGHTGQWRPHSDGVAGLAGTDHWSRASIRHVTDDVRAAIALDREYRKALAKIDAEAKRLQSLSRDGTKDEVVAAAALIGEPSNA